MALSDAESDGYSLLEAPRPSLQERMLQAIKEGCLHQLVLDRQADLSRSIALCLEVLGLGTSTCAEQCDAARALKALCTHRKLRPAVDNLLVLRRLCRIIELTDSAAALRAAAEALFAIADDAAWQQSRSGSVAEVLREALARCISTLDSIDSSRLPSSETIIRAGSNCSADQRDIVTESEQAALAAAAAAVLRPPVLALLSPDQLLSGVKALAACLARGYDEPPVLAALAEMLRAVSHGTERSAAAAAVVEAGAVSALVQAVTAGTQRQQQQVQLTESGKDGFFCLTDVLIPGNNEAGDISGSIRLVWTPVLKRAATSALLRLLELSIPEDANRALYALSVLASHTESESQENVVVEALKAASDAERTALLTAALDAAKRILTGGSAGGVVSDIARACVLLELFASFLLNNMVTVQQLRSQASGLIGAAIGVLLGASPGAEWSGLCGPLWSAHSSSTPGDSSGKSYPFLLQSAAVKLVHPLLGYALRTDRPEWEEWLHAKELAVRLLNSLVHETPTFEQLGSAAVQVCMLCLQLTSPQELWKEETMRNMLPKLAGLLEDPSHIADLSQTDARLAALQLAAVVLVSGWRGISSGHGSFPVVSRPTLEALLHLATSLLNQAAALWAATPPQQLALVAGVVNAIIACLWPNAARFASSKDQLLLPELSATLLQARGGPEETVLTLSPVFDLSDCRANHRTPPSLSVQVQWRFESPPPEKNSVASVLSWFGERYSSSYSHRYLAFPHPTEYKSVASTTAPALLQALCSATGRLTQLVGELVEATAAGPGSSMGGTGAAEAAGGEGKITALVCAALAVSKGATTVLAKCVPPGSKKCD